MVRRLLLFNGLAAIAAVSHHAITWVLTAMFWWTDKYLPATTVPNYDQLGGPIYYAIRGIDQLSFFAVSAFLFVSGYFVASTAGTASAPVGWKMVANRVKVLLPPYFVWSCAVIALNTLSGEQYSASRFLWVMLTGGAAAPFYYIPLLIQLYALSIWLVRLARRHPGVLLMVTGAVQFSVAGMRSCLFTGADACGAVYAQAQFLLDWPLTAYSFWFAIGLVAASHPAAFKTFLRRLKPYLPALFLIMEVAAFFEWQTLQRLSGRPWIAGGICLTDNFVSLTLMLTFLAFDELPLPHTDRIREIGVMSYGIYLIHIPVLEVSARALYHVAPALLASPVVLFVVLTAVGVGVPVMLMRLVKFTPLRGYYSYVFG